MGILENGAAGAEFLIRKKKALNNAIYDLLTSKNFQDNYRYLLIHYFSSLFFFLFSCRINLLNRSKFIKHSDLMVLYTTIMQYETRVILQISLRTHFWELLPLALDMKVTHGNGIQIIGTLMETSISM